MAKGWVYTFSLLSPAEGSDEKSLPHPHAPDHRAALTASWGPRVSPGDGRGATHPFSASTLTLAWPPLPAASTALARNSSLWSPRQGFTAPHGRRLCGSSSALAELFLGLGGFPSLQGHQELLVLAEGSSRAQGGRAPGVPLVQKALGTGAEES